MNNFKKNRIFYCGMLASFFVLSVFNAEGQYQYRWQPPTGKVNMFITQDDTEAAIKYNSLKTRNQRDSLISSKLNGDWTHTMQGGVVPPTVWVCHHFTEQLMVNSHNWGDGVFTSEELLYNNYRGSNLDSIYLNGGTLKDMGKLGIPLWDVSIYDPVTMPSGHALVAVLTGNDFTKWGDWNFIEVQMNTTNVQPGGQTYMAKDCEQVYIGYTHLTFNEHGQKLRNFVTVLGFEIKDGIPTLTYNVNEGKMPPNYYTNPHFNEIFQVIEKRDSLPPEITISLPVDAVYTDLSPLLNYNITDENFKSAWYTLDNGKTKIPVSQSGSRNLGLPNGDYSLILFAEDWFGLSSTDTVTFTLDRPTAFRNTIADSGLVVYPNPVTGIGTFAYPVGKSIRIEIFNSAGKLMGTYADHDQNGENLVDFSHWDSGLYVYRFVDTDGTVYMGKVMKK